MTSFDVMVDPEMLRAEVRDNYRSAKGMSLDHVEFRDGSAENLACSATRSCVASLGCDGQAEGRPGAGYGPSLS